MLFDFRNGQFILCTYRYVCICVFRISNPLNYNYIARIYNLYINAVNLLFHSSAQWTMNNVKCKMYRNGIKNRFWESPFETGCWLLTNQTKNCKAEYTKNLIQNSEYIRMYRRVVSFPMNFQPFMQKPKPSCSCNVFLRCMHLQ